MASLVSYENSDESDSDIEAQVSNDVEIVKHDSKPTTSKHSDDSNEELNVINERESDNENAFNSSLFKSLPAPKTRTGSEAYFDEEEDDEFLDIRTVSAKNHADSDFDTSKVQSHFQRERSTLILPSVKQNNFEGNEKEELVQNKTTAFNKKSEKSVKIHVPPLSAYDSDDEKEPVKKKIKPNQGKSGLFQILPSPKNLPTKSTTLVPHSVSRPQQQKGKSLPSKTMDVKTKTMNPVPNYLSSNHENDSDDDDEPSNFFSLNETETPLPAVYTEPAVADNQYSWDSNPNLNSAAEEDINLNMGPVAGSTLNENYPIQGAMAPPENPPSGDNTLEIDDEILLRLQGKRRHKQEEINIIDVSQGDQLAQNAEWLMKDLTEEKVSRAHRLKTHLPTAQQRRKHQITYLAFQAKERELELKNQWAQNRLTKRQTQSKYGF